MSYAAEVETMPLPLPGLDRDPKAAYRQGFLDARLSAKLIVETADDEINRLEQALEQQRVISLKLAMAIRYPEAWDVSVYPTLDKALETVYACYQGLTSVSTWKPGDKTSLLSPTFQAVCCKQCAADSPFKLSTLTGDFKAETNHE